MAANTTPIFPIAPFSVSVLSALSACTTRAPTAYGTAGATLAATPVYATKLLAAAQNVNGIRVDKIQAKSVTTNIAAASASCTVMIWMVDPSNTANIAYIIDELQHVSVAASTTVPSVQTSNTYTTLTIPAGYELWVSSTVAYAAATQAIEVTLFGGAY